MVDTVPNISFEDLLNEIETGSSGSIASVICKIRNHEDFLFSSGRGAPIGELAASFAESITARIGMKNDEIQRACSENSSSFAATTRQLIEIQSETQEIETALSEVGNDFRNSVGFLDEVFSQLTEHKTSLDSIDKTIEALELAIPILELYGSIRESIQNKRQYHALKSLSNLEKYKLPLIKKYAFAAAIQERIPLLRAEIKQSSLQEVTNFLEVIRSKSVEIGEIAMRQTAVMNGFVINDEKFAKFDLSGNSDNRKAALEPEHKKSIANSAVNIEVEELNNLFRTYQPFKSQLNDEEGPQNVDSLNVLDSILDFTSVYRCMHIHSVLNEKLEFEKHYCNQRKKQLGLSLSYSARQEKEVEDYMNFYGNIVGFFKVDECLRHTLPSHSSVFQAHIEENWACACTKLLQFAKNNASNEKHTLDDIIKLKDYTELFIRTMYSLGFSTTGLSELIDTIRSQFVKVLSKEYTKRFEKILQEDNYGSITINSNMDYSDYLSQYPIEDTSKIYPKTLHYSPMVPRIFYEITKFVNQCKIFNKNIDISLTEIEDNINRAVNTLILDHINVSLLQVIKLAISDLNKLVMLCLNMGEFERMCRFVGSYIDRSLNPDIKSPALNELPIEKAVVPRPKIGIHSLEKFKKATGNMTQVSGMESWSNMLENPNLLGLKVKMNSEIDQVNAQFTIDCARLFQNLGKQCEDAIYETLTEKVDGFLELIEYPGCNGSAGHEEQTGRIMPSVQITEMFTWLKTNFNAFSHLPPKVAQTACMNVCKHIDKMLLEVLIGDHVTNISRITIEQVACDLQLCEQFARSDMVTGLDASDLLLIFSDLRQLITLYQTNSWNSYIQIYGSKDNVSYNRVRPDQCIKLLEHLKEGMASGFMSLINREDREVKKRFEEIIRRLKEKKKHGFQRTENHS